MAACENPPWEALRVRLRERLAMAREVRDQRLVPIAALLSIEEVLIWMDEIEATDGTAGS